jgi:hypothetical protein
MLRAPKDELRVYLDRAGWPEAKLHLGDIDDGFFGVVAEDEFCYRHDREGFSFCPGYDGQLVHHGYGADECRSAAVSGSRDSGTGGGGSGAAQGRCWKKREQ